LVQSERNRKHFGVCRPSEKNFISYDPDIEDAFVVHLGNKVVKFKATPEGL